MGRKTALVSPQCLYISLHPLTSSPPTPTIFLHFPFQQLPALTILLAVFSPFPAYTPLSQPQYHHLTLLTTTSPCHHPLLPLPLPRRMSASAQSLRRASSFTSRRAATSGNAPSLTGPVSKQLLAIGLSVERHLALTHSYSERQKATRSGSSSSIDSTNSETSSTHSK